MKIGDKVICISGFHSKGYHKPKYGGAGYVEGKVFTIDRIYGNLVVWYENGEDGVFTFAVEPYNDRKSRIDNLNL